MAAGLEQRLAQIEGLEAIEVRVEAGVVRLSGEAQSSAAHETATSIARRTDGVAEVVDEVRVARGVRDRVLPALGKLSARARDFVAWLPLLGVALVIFALFVFIARRVSRSRAVVARISPNPFLQDLLRQLASGVVLIIGALLTLELLEATTLVGAVLGTAGVFGLALGFAFRDLVENYIASVLLSVRQPFAPGDHVVVDGHEGKVVRLTSRATILMTLDGNHLRIPNASVFKGVVLNYTRNPKRRFEFAVGVAPESDPALPQAKATAVLATLPGVLAEPAPWTQIESLGDSTVNLRVFGWVDQSRHGLAKVKGEAIRQVMAAFEAEGIAMPEPTYRLLTEAVSAAVPAPPETAAARKPADLAAGDDIDAQVAAERATTGDEDLLNASAPQE